MKAKKAIKKIVALGMGATMLGATLLGASAADLKDYPGMFIEDGQFNGLIVVGENADAVDTLGSTNIAMGLQAASYTETLVCEEGEEDDSTVISVEDGIKIESSSEKLYKYVQLGTIKPTLDDTDLPDMLADGTYTDDDSKSHDFTQKLNLETGGGANKFLSTQDDKNGADPAGYYIEMPKKETAYSYVLEFDSPISIEDGEEENLEASTIDIQGRTYTITDVTIDSSDKLTEMELLVGDTRDWLVQGQTITAEGHEIEMFNINDNNIDPQCGLIVDGTTHWIDEGSTKTIGDLEIGVINVLPVRTDTADSDMCEITLGAKKMILSDGDEVEVDNEEIEGSTVYLTSVVTGGNPSYNAGEWSGITIEWAPEELTYLPFAGDDEDKQLVDPVFGNFKYVAANVIADNENIVYDFGSNSGTITFNNNGGKEVVLPVTEEDGDIYLGDGADPDEQIYWLDNENGTFNTCAFTAGDVINNVEECESARWFVSYNGKAQILELSDISYDDEDELYEIDMLETVSGTPKDGIKVTLDSNTTGVGEFYMSGVGNLNMNITDGTIQFTTGDLVDDGDQIETEYGMVLQQMVYYTAANGQGLNIMWEEEEAPENDFDGFGAAKVNTTIYADSDDDIVLGSPKGLNGPSIGPDKSVSYSEDNEDLLLFASTRGTVAAYDSDDEQDLTIMYPAEDVYGEVYITPESSGISSKPSDNCQTVKEPNEIPSSVVKFDSEVMDATAQNLITIGGPCANSVSSALMGDPEVCSEGFESSMALLKLVENDDNVALIVAGGDGKDTRIASKVLQNYKEYSELTGSELKLTTVSESNIGFEAVE